MVVVTRGIAFITNVTLLKNYSLYSLLSSNYKKINFIIMLRFKLNVNSCNYAHLISFRTLCQHVTAIAWKLMKYNFQYCCRQDCKEPLDPLGKFLTDGNIQICF